MTAAGRGVVRVRTRRSTTRKQVVEECLLQIVSVTTQVAILGKHPALNSRYWVVKRLERERRGGGGGWAVADKHMACGAGAWLRSTVVTF